MARRTTARAVKAPGNQAADRVRTGDPELGKLGVELDPNRLLRTPEVAQLLRCSTNAVTLWKRKGLIRPISPVGHPRYSLGEILRFVRSRDPHGPLLKSAPAVVPMPPTVREMLERVISNEAVHP